MIQGILSNDLISETLTFINFNTNRYLKLNYKECKFLENYDTNFSEDFLSMIKEFNNSYESDNKLEPKSLNFVPKEYKINCVVISPYNRELITAREVDYDFIFKLCNEIFH